MGRVMGVLRRSIIGYRHRKSLFGGLVLQVKEEIWEWDTNTGEEETYPRIKWRDALLEECEAYHQRGESPGVSEDEQRIRRMWYKLGAHAARIGNDISSCIGTTLAGNNLTAERQACFEAGWRFAMKKEFSYQPEEKQIMKINVTTNTDTIQVGKLAYGTFVTGVPSHPNKIYQKVNKRNVGQGLLLKFPAGHSLLMNVELGSLRLVPGDTQVAVYDAELNLSRTVNFAHHLKDERGPF